MSLQGKKQCAAVGLKAAGTGGKPTPEQLAAINGFTLEAMTADQVYARSFYMAHNAMDRDQECFAEPLLADFAKTMPGKGMFVKHPMSYDGDTGPGAGRWYGAEVQRMSFAEARQALRQPDLQWPPTAKEAQILVTHGYMPVTDGNKDLRANIDAGVAGDCSIGFNAMDRIKVMDAEQNLMGYQWTGPGEALEGSLVWLAAQPGARAYKSLDREPNEETDMELKDALALITKHENRIKELEPKAASFDAISNAVGGEFAANPGALKRAVEDGTGAREQAISDIVAIERQNKEVGDSEAEVKAAKAVYADMPMKTLGSILGKLKGLQKTAGGDLGGGDPNGGTGAGAEIDPKTGKKKTAAPAQGGEKSAVMPGVEDNPLLAQE